MGKLMKSSASLIPKKIINVEEITKIDPIRFSFLPYSMFCSLLTMRAHLAMRKMDYLKCEKKLITIFEAVSNKVGNCDLDNPLQDYCYPVLIEYGENFTKDKASRRDITKTDEWIDVFIFVSLLKTIQYIERMAFHFYDKNNGKRKTITELIHHIEGSQQESVNISYLESTVLSTLMADCITANNMALTLLLQTGAVSELNRDLEFSVNELAKKKYIASETGRSAVTKGRYEPRDKRLKQLIPLIDKISDGKTKHHLIAQKIYKMSLNGEPTFRYYTTKGLPQDMTPTEIKNFVKKHFENTEREHLIYGKQN